ncbi:hypothetical protein KUTeg_011680 [Tegillarca granosa]|uniref:Uncharacterized protein n=1 Tax=Tegillarca granosa TaxID=220873 RepID=A0ABQ9EXB9_TEGGR|nr:hypothetical protein KUTeg_011680 [Tegillarca granosa]
MSSSSSLSPWDISGLGPGFGLHRSRRPSYTYATQIGGRQRTESYRYALRKSTGDEEEPPDFVESMISKRPRKESYIRATRKNLDSLEMDSIPDNHQADSLNVTANNHVENRKDPIICREKVVEELKAAVANRSKSPKSKNVYRINSEMNPDLQKEIQRDFKNAKPDNTEILNSLEPVDGREMVGTPCSELSSNVPSVVILTFKKNLIFLCISFIMLFSAFRAIQNLQTSINAKNHLGSISMSCVHGTMFLTCLWAPTIINTLSAKWAIVCGMFSLLVWIGANFYPRFYTLIPTAIFSGFGQGILWTAEISYILKLAFDSSRITKDGVDKEVFRFHGIFLACFQTTHIWGNLISSLMLHHWTNGASNKSIQPLDDFTIDQMDIGENGNYTMDMGTNIGYDVEMGVKEPSCGNLYPCIPGISADQTRKSNLNKK